MALHHLNLNILWLLKFLAFAVTIHAHRPFEYRVIQQQVGLLKDLMVELHTIHHFDNFIIYRNDISLHRLPTENIFTLKSLHHGKYMHEEILYKDVGRMITEHVFLSPQLHKPLMTFNISPGNCSSSYANNSRQAVPNLGKILNNKNLAVVILDDIFNMKLNEFVALSLGRCLETKIVFLLLGHELNDIERFASFEKMRKFFLLLWSKNILNAVLLFQERHFYRILDEMKFEVYTYTPFPMPAKMIRLTDKHPEEYFPDRTLNLMGYVFRTPVIPDKPLVFKTLDPFTGAETVTGISGKIYTEYVEYLNATFEQLNGGINVNGSFAEIMDYIYELLVKGTIDISIRPLTALSPNKFFTSYPISNSNTCVIVPVKPEIFPGLYIPRTLSFRMWLLLALLFLSFQIVYMLINYDIYGLLRPWLAFSITLKGLLSMPVDNMGRYKTISKNSISFKRKIFVHMLLLLTGLIYTQSQIAALSSFLSSTLYPQQIESLEDLVKANISIMLVDYTFDGYNYLDLIPDNFTQNLILTDANTVAHHLNRLDTRYAYTVYNEEWKVIQYLQRGLKKPRFKLVSKLCIPNVYLILPMQFNSPFYRSFKEFILYAQAAGLNDKWSDMIYWQLHKASKIQVSTTESLEYSAPLRLEHLIYVLYTYFGGLLMAFVVFLVELITPRLGKSFRLF